jgi:8-oxo-dGTP pyrophosphatase MutT (NUDIX family)
MIKIKIVKSINEKQKDSDVVAKIVIIDNENRVLMLTRSDYHKKYAGELDLPGGHIKKNEPLNKGLKREVEEETGLIINGAVFFKTIKNKHFYYTRYDSQPIKLSDEHTDYAFYEKKQLDSSQKFQKIAIDVLEKIKND